MVSKKESIREKIDQVNKVIDSNRNMQNQYLNEVISKIKENITLADSIGYYDGLAEAYRILASNYCYAGYSDKAFEALSNAEKTFLINGVDQKILVRIYNTYVIYYGEVKKDYSMTIIYCHKGLTLAKEIKDNEMIRRLTMNLGLAFYQIGLYSDSLALLEEALSYAELLKAERGKLYAYSNLSNCYYCMKDYSNAEKYYQKTFQKSQELEDVITFASSSLGLAKLSHATKEKVVAYNYLTNAIYLLRKHDQRGWELNLSLELLKFYIDDEIIDSVEDLLPRVELIAKELRNDEYTATLYKVKAKYFELKKIFTEAVSWCYKALELQETVFKKREADSIRQIKNSILSKRLEQLEAIAEIGRRITSYSHLEEIFEEVNKALGKIYDEFNFAIGILDGNKVKYDFYYFRGELICPFVLPLNNKNSFGNYAIRNETSVIIGDMKAEYKRYIEEFVLFGSTDEGDVADSLMATPLKDQNEVIGVIQIQRYMKNGFSVEDMKILEIIGAYTAIAIRNSIQLEELKSISNKDALTGLYNWRYFNQYLKSKCDSCQESDSYLSLSIVDIDYFKKVNDKHGHEAGNECLRQISEIIMNSFDDSAVVARIGGEEFAIIESGTCLDSIIKRAQEVVDRIANTIIEDKEQEIKVTVSLGQVIYTKNLGTIDETFKEADEALYQAKAQGRNRAVVKVIK